MTSRHSLASVSLAIVAAPLAGQGTRPMVNAPVAPEAIYVGTGGATPGVSVIDLNGFGQGTGNPMTTRFPFNPNIGAPGVTPPLAPGFTSLDAGGAGVLTLTEDSAGDTRLIGAPAIGAVTELQLGQPLDLVFNNANINPLASRANQVNPATMVVAPGNTIMVAPHPNPPRLVFPPPNPMMGIGNEEPTVTSSAGPPGSVLTTSPPCVLSPINLLGIGNPFSTKASEIGLLHANFPNVFYGPQPAPPVPPPPPAFCPFTSRQQIGHFLYALDRDNRRVVVLNSNRFTVLATFPFSEPADIAVSPNLAVLAVSDTAADAVAMIDIDPFSRSFHQVVAVTAVGDGPTGIAWQPEGEDLLVCNTSGNSVSILSGRDFQVRRTLTRLVRAPRDVVATPRQEGIGLDTKTYFAYVLNGDSSVLAYESGPGDLGPDDVVRRLPFLAASALQPDTASLGSAFWVGHRDSAGLGQLSRVELTAVPPDADAPQWTVTTRFGGITMPLSLLSGNTIADIAFDDLENVGGLPDWQSSVSAGLPLARHSGKGFVKSSSSGPVRATSPRLAFVACSDAGTVDIIDLTTLRNIRTLAVPGVASLGNYWRQ